MRPVGEALFYLDRADRVESARLRHDFEAVINPETIRGRRPQDYCPPDLAAVADRLLWSVRLRHGLVGPFPYAVQLPSSGLWVLRHLWGCTLGSRGKVLIAVRTIRPWLPLCFLDC